MAMTVSAKYDVGGVMLDRPFKIRRLGHFGFNVADMEANTRFYVDLLGFRKSDVRPGNAGFFSRHGGDHHSFVMFNKEIVEQQTLAGPGARHYRPENDINQITWQVQSLKEVTDATRYFRDLEMEIMREGRAGGPGSNFHLYVYDPDEQINELFYGIEQVGWDGHSKPAEMRHGMLEASDAPHLSEYQEVQDDLARGIDMNSGYRFID
jgi:catechol 2,3-dioxygenase-like lactoylglutathione lyase family enzyme